MELKFGQLPAKTTNNKTSKWAAEAAALRSNPMQWAHVTAHDGKSGNQISAWANAVNRGRLKSFPIGEFEAVSRNGQAWIRFVGASRG